MNCPTCPSSSLVITDRSGVEIDYCPKCRGVWLDRGELDKLIDRDASKPERYEKYVHSKKNHPNQRGRGRKSWLSDIFD